MRATLIPISWFALVALVALVFVLVKGLANPITRPFVIGILAFVGLGAFVLFMYRSSEVARFEEQATIAREQVVAEQAQARETWQRQSVAEKHQTNHAMASKPKDSTATVVNRPRMTIAAALEKAVLNAWTGSHPPASQQQTSQSPAMQPQTPQPPQPPFPPEPPQLAEAPAASTSQPDPPAVSQPPAWIHAAEKTEGNTWSTTIHAGPYTTKWECERELPQDVQQAVSDYAEPALGHEAAAVRLPEETLRQLVRDRWAEVKPSRFGDTTQDMTTLYARVVIDPPMQQRIKSAAERVVINERVERTAVLFGGVVGLLGLAWGSLRLVTRRETLKNAASS
jgi:hypothetical protein